MLNLQQDVELTALNSFHLKSIATHYLALNQIKQLDEMTSFISRYPQFFVLGGGSNLIVPSHYDGLVIHNRLRGISIEKVGEELFVRAMAGENWDDFVAYCCSNNAFGLENLSLIPGTVGASPIQNIGAYGVEVKDFIDEIQVYDLQQSQIVTLKNEACEFSYRTSLLKNNPRFIVISVRFKLSAQPHLNQSYGEVAQGLTAISNPTPQDLRQLIIRIRQSKLPNPHQLGNAGSFFHNPILSMELAQKFLIEHPSLSTFPTANPDFIKISAGRLIDNLGLKGVKQGNVGVYTQHALVLVNYGGAYQSELLNFAGWIQSQVLARYDVALTIEPTVVR